MVSKSMMLYVCYDTQKRAFSILWLLGSLYLTPYSCFVSSLKRLLALLDLTPISKMLKNYFNILVVSVVLNKNYNLGIVWKAIQSTHRENYNIFFTLKKLLRKTDCQQQKISWGVLLTLICICWSFVFTVMFWHIK